MDIMQFLFGAKKKKEHIVRSQQGQVPFPQRKYNHSLTLPNEEEELEIRRRRSSYDDTNSYSPIWGNDYGSSHTPDYSSPSHDFGGGSGGGAGASGDFGGSDSGSSYDSGSSFDSSSSSSD